VFVNRLRFRDVKPLNLDIPENGEELPVPARKRLLLQGGNGSGKTTILETITALWTFWGEWIEVGDQKSPPRQHLKHSLLEEGFAAMEIVAVIPEALPIWIGMGWDKDWKELRHAHSKNAFAGLFKQYAHLHALRSEWRIQLPPSGGLDLLSFRHGSLVAREPRPNIVYFPSEDRTIRKAKNPRAELLDTISYNWLARFDRNLSLDSVLLTVKAREPERFEECLRFVNLALGHRRKRITGFGENGRLVVEGESESGKRYQHPIEELSSGEKQMLLMLGFTIAFLRPGGIVLLHDPDLHIHVSMVARLIESLEQIVRQCGGLLIAASHSESAWDRFSRVGERIELNPWHGGRS
jgi:ABC-type lipoprotein export system ATPase subunit